jgi:hypothetical protein
LGIDGTKYIEFSSSPKERKTIELYIGMRAEQVENSSWGKPKEKNVTTYAWGTHEQWVYSSGNYIYLENGVVTAIQEKQ